LLCAGGADNGTLGASRRTRRTIVSGSLEKTLTVDAVLPPQVSPADLKLGLFDIMQVDPVLQQDPRTMYQQRLDHLALADELGFDIAFSAERHFLPNYVCPRSPTRGAIW
jgi:hypothetical protein